MSQISLATLPYDILHLILTQLDLLRLPPPSTPRFGPRPQIPTKPTHHIYEYFHRTTLTLPPPKPHDSPRRAEKHRLEQANKRGGKPNIYPYLPEPTPAHPGPFEGVSVFDGLSRTNKYLRSLCGPYVFRSVVLASDDCLTVDRVEFYAEEEREWIYEHVRSFRIHCTHTTYPSSLSAQTPSFLATTAVSNLIHILQSLPNLRHLHFHIEPTSLINLFRDHLTSFKSPPIFSPNLKSLYINTDHEYLIPLCGSKDHGLEEFEYKAAPGLKSENKVDFMAWGRPPSTQRVRNTFGEDDEEALYNDMHDPRAVLVIRGLQSLQPGCLKKLVLWAFIHDTGIEQMAKAGILENVREMILYYGIASSCATSLTHLPSLRLIRFAQDDEPAHARNPHCYMSRRELLMVVRNGKKLEEVWHKDRFVCYVKRLQDGQVDEENTWWEDTWAEDGKGEREVISSDYAPHPSFSPEGFLIRQMFQS